MPTDVEQAFRDGMIRLFRQGSPDNVNQLSLDIARDIEAAWLRLEGATPGEE
jgi:hypothetical protein